MLVIKGNKTINLSQYGSVDMVRCNGRFYVSARSAHSNFSVELYCGDSEAGAQNTYNMIIDAWKGGRPYLELT